MVEPDNPPGVRCVEDWLGARAYGNWRRVLELIDCRYPGVFAPEWLFGGKKHGWALRFKKSKSFCTLIPERRKCRLLIVFGAEERDRVAAVRRDLSPDTRRRYDASTTYYDGKWLLLDITSAATLVDVATLLAVKRRPRARP